MEAGVFASLPLRLTAPNCTVGTGSSSMIVAVALDELPNVAPPVGLDSVTVNVSFGSSRASFVIGTLIVWFVTPGLNVNVPLVAV
jgi:hypothetical protein